MKVGLLLITHGNIGHTLYDAVVSMLGNCPLNIRILAIHMDNEPENSVQQARELLAELDNGAGVLVLTDMYGSTPSNIACKLRNEQGVSIVTGINLPMLVRILNYPDLSREELVEKALSGGREGVMSCHHVKS